MGMLRIMHVTSNRILSLYLVSIKKLFNEAKRKFNKKDKNLILIPNSPFEDFKIPKQEATRKRAIPADIIKKVWKLLEKPLQFQGILLYIIPFTRMLQQFIINKTLYNLLFLERLQHKSVQVAQNGNLL